MGYTANMSDTVFFNQHPLLLVVTNSRGKVYSCSPWAERELHIELGTLMQEYFYEDDASRVISILQACDPIVRRPFRLEVREGIVRHVLCTVLISGD
jgi:hypothetical protein